MPSAATEAITGISNFLENLGPDDVVVMGSAVVKTDADPEAGIPPSPTVTAGWMPG
jgi:hypothetical protein